MRLVYPGDVLAAVTQEEFLRSVSNHGGEPVGMGRILAVVGGGVAILLLLFVLHQLQKRRSLPRVLHHHGKLMREVLREVPLKSADMKRLKVLAEAKGCSSPLTLLLCPSLVKKGSGKAE